MPTPVIPRCVTALAVALVVATAGAGWLWAPRAAADPMDEMTALCQDAPRGCNILWESVPTHLDSTSVHRARVQGSPGVTVQLAMYEILFSESDEVIGLKEFRRTDPMTTASNGVAPQFLGFSDIDPDNPPSSGQGLVSVAGLPEDLTDLSGLLLAEQFPMAHARPLVLSSGWPDEELPAGQEATLEFMGGSPSFSYQLWFLAPGEEPRVISSAPAAATVPPEVGTITYTIPEGAGEGVFRLASSDDYFAPLEWPVTVIGDPDPTEDPDPSGEPAPTPSSDPTVVPEPTEPTEPSDPAPTTSPDPTTSQPEPTPPPTSSAPSRPRPTSPSTTPNTPPSAQPTQPSEPAPEPPSAAPTPTPEPTQFGSAPPEPEERVRTQERAERITDAASGAATAPRWSGGLVGGLATTAIVGAAAWLWRSRRETAATLARREDE